METYKTVAGMEIPIQPITISIVSAIESTIEKNYKKAGKQITPPTYELKTGPGDIEVFTYDEVSIKDAPEEDKKKWEAYLRDSDDMKNEVSIKQTNYVMGEGIALEPPDDGWMEKLQEYGVDFTEGIEAGVSKKVIWLTSCVLKTPQDQNDVFLSIMKLSVSGISEEKVAEFEASFRGSISK